MKSKLIRNPKLIGFVGNQPVYEVAGSHPNFTVDQTEFAFYNDGTESGAVIIGSIGSDASDLSLDTIYHVRFEITETGGGSSNNVTWQLEYQVGGGGYNPVNATSTNVRSAGTGAGLTEDSDTTQRLGGGGTFVGGNGQDEVDGLAGGTANDWLGSEIGEVVFAFTLRSADLSGGEAIDLRLNGMDAYTVADASLTVASAVVTHDLEADIEANATVEGNIQTDVQLSADVEANATVEGNLQITTDVANVILEEGQLSYLNGDTFTYINGDLLNYLDPPLNPQGAVGNATVTGDIQVDRQIASDVEGNATVTGDIQVDVQLASDIEGNATVEGNLQVDTGLSAEIEGNATVEADLEVESPASGVTHDIAADIEANATVEGNIQTLPGVAADIEGNATVEANLQTLTGLSADIEGNATVEGDIQVDVQLSASVEGNATVEGNIQSDTLVDASVEANAIVTGDIQVSRQIASDIEGNATVEANLQTLTGLSADVEANATVEGDIQVDVQLSAEIEGNATAEGNIQSDTLIEASVEGNATVEGNIQVDVQIAADVEGNATVEADLTSAGEAVELSASIEANATVEGNIQITVDIRNLPSAILGMDYLNGDGLVYLDGNVFKYLGEVASGDGALASAFVSGFLTIPVTHDIASDVEANATVTGNLQVDVQVASDVEANATVEGNIEVSAQQAASVEGNATVEGNIQVIRQIASDVEANATVDADLEVTSPPTTHDLEASIEANATVEAALELITEAVEEITRGAFVPPPSKRKDTAKKQREDKDAEKREIARELEAIFNKINGIEEAQEELAEIVEPFDETPEEDKSLDLQPQLQHINFEALSAQADAAQRLFELMDRINRSKEDDDALALLLLVS